MKENRTFVALDENGNERECEVIMFYQNDENNMNYIFYTDNQLDQEGNLNLYASRYFGEDGKGMVLEEIVDENEWNSLEKVLGEAKKGLEG